MRLAVVRDHFGGPNDAMTYAALARVNGWEVSYCRTPALDEATAPGLLHHAISALGIAARARAINEGMGDGISFYEPAELGYDWTRAVVEAFPGRVFPLVWQNLPWTDATEHTAPIIKRAAGFIARSNMARELLRLYGVEHDRIHLCHAAVDTERFTPAPRVADGQVRILFAGRPVAEKGISDLVWALLALPPEHREKVTLVLAGGAGLEVPGLKVEALGPVPHHQMPAVYQGCDLFVYATWPTAGWLEQWGLSVVEAMACGLPVITTDIGAFDEIHPPELRRTWMVPARDWVKLRDRIAQLIEHPSLRMTLGNRNREWTVSEFDGRKTAAQYAKAFSS